jgi:cation-transporting ATPase E
LPDVLAEGRRVIGNVERVANLFVAKNVMSLIAIISAAVFFLPFPFLPRHLTLVSTVTIGIPAFFLALGPNKRRYVPGFLARVLRFAIPTGIIAGVAVIAAYLIAHGTYGGQTAETGTGATLALVVVFLWILVCLARPFRLWKALLIAAMALIAVLAFTVPAMREFFDFSLPAQLAWWTLGIGAIGAIGVEVVYRTFGKPSSTV